MDLERLRRNLDEVRGRIDAACRRAGRDAAGVRLVVVTKSIPAEAIPPLAGAGVTDIGERRPVEGGRRVGELTAFRRHMVGHIQTNKVRKTLAWADVIHSVDRMDLVAALSAQPERPPVYVQVNVSGESSKGGFGPDEAEEAVREASRTLKVEGLMTMAPAEGDPRPVFRGLRELAERCGVGGLSMGMTQDFEAAVEEGATCVRIGTGVFDSVFGYTP